MIVKKTNKSIKIIKVGKFYDFNSFMPLIKSHDPEILQFFFSMYRPLDLKLQIGKLYQAIQNFHATKSNGKTIGIGGYFMGITPRTIHPYIFMQKRYTGMGVGTKILKMIENEANRTFTEFIVAHIDYRNLGAQRLLKKSGYVQKNKNYSTKEISKALKYTKSNMHIQSYQSGCEQIEKSPLAPLVHIYKKHLL